MTTRVIAHLDMDCFFAAVEELDDDSLVGRPVIVGGRGPRGVVATANYVARQYGVASAMPMSRARRLCSHAVVIAPRMGRYRAMSARVFAVLEREGFVVEPVSLDEAYLDLPAGDLDHGRARSAAIRTRVKMETGLPVSMGVGSCKLVAKLACERAKPDGLVVVEPGDEVAFLDPHPTSALPGVGKVTARELTEIGIDTVSALHNVSAEQLESRVGPRVAAWLIDAARGVDTRLVVGERDAQQFSAEETLWDDTSDHDRLVALLEQLVARVARRLVVSGRAGNTVTVKLRRADFATRTRQISLDAPTDSQESLMEAARSLLNSLLAAGVGGVRLVGFGVSGIGSAAQDSLPLDAGGESRSIDHPVFGRGRIVWGDGQAIAVRFSDGRVRDLDPAFLAGVRVPPDTPAAP